MVIRFQVNMTVEQAQNARDSLSMLLYSQMFEYLVARINKSITQKGKSKAFIGVLDIYGFESFAKNSFEQFWYSFHICNALPRYLLCLVSIMQTRSYSNCSISMYLRYDNSTFFRE